MYKRQQKERANKRWRELKGAISEDVGGTYSAASRIQRSWTQAAALDSGIQLGKLRFEQTKSSASVAVVPGIGDAETLQRRADALARVMDVNWRMPRPDVIFAITGGAKDLALAEGQEHALRLAMETAAELEGAALVTAGTNVGLSSMFGQWRETRDEEGSPLIGIAPKHKVHAHDQVLEYRDLAPEKANKVLGPAGETSVLYATSKRPNSLEPNHSHHTHAHTSQQSGIGSD